jgi:hypothetical protein
VQAAGNNKASVYRHCLVAGMILLLIETQQTCDLQQTEYIYQPACQMANANEKARVGAAQMHPVSCEVLLISAASLATSCKVAYIINKGTHTHVSHTPLAFKCSQKRCTPTPGGGLNLQL